MSSLATEKMKKAMESLYRAFNEYDKGMKRKSIGSLDHVKDNCIKAIHLIFAEIEQEQNN